VRMIMSVCLTIFFSLRVCLAGADSDRSECLIWSDPARSVCPNNYRPKITPGENILVIGDKIQTSGARRKGSCWDFVSTVYDCAGYSTKRVFPSNENFNKNGPYLKDGSVLQPGDWIMHINEEYRRRERIEHSAIFVRWIDKEKKEAWMLDYVGNNQCVQAGYKQHTLTKIYGILRTIPSMEETAEKHNFLADEIPASCKE
jgi:hypothetical protein